MIIKIMRKIQLFINKNPNSFNIIIGLIGFTVAGIAFYDFKIMLKLLIGVVLFSIVMGLIFFLIKIFFR